MTIRGPSHGNWRPDSVRSIKAAIRRRCICMLCGATPSDGDVQEFKSTWGHRDPATGEPCRGHFDDIEA